MQNINTQGKTALGLDVNIGALICYVGNFVCSFGLIYNIEKVKIAANSKAKITKNKVSLAFDEGKKNTF